MAEVSGPGGSFPTINRLDDVGKYAVLGEERGRFPWLPTGRVAGGVPDHEPLIAAPVPLARVSPSAVDEATAVYKVAFRVVRDSGGRGETAAALNSGDPSRTGYQGGPPS
ncbi:DUF6098 family protein [Nocardia sp. CA-290969]|uniref:DUF6098 family protein n=1 Tax=Nocardia sp. CA-290969 TaxID=3239986 RepID=UPI003D912595